MYTFLNAALNSSTLYSLNIDFIKCFCLCYLNFNVQKYDVSLYQTQERIKDRRIGSIPSPLHACNDVGVVFVKFDCMHAIICIVLSTFTAKTLDNCELYS